MRSAIFVTLLWARELWPNSYGMRSTVSLASYAKAARSSDCCPRYRVAIIVGQRGTKAMSLRRLSSSGGAGGSDHVLSTPSLRGATIAILLIGHLDQIELLTPKFSHPR